VIGKRHVVIPDTQVKEGVPTDHLEACGNYIAEKKPDTIVMIGDFADMPSLSTHQDRGHIEYEGRRYLKDISAANRGMERLVKPFRGIRGYKPRMVLTLGNHEDRITRAVAQDPKLEGKLALSDLYYEQLGWEVHDFLKPVKINGVAYCHYFVSGKYDRPIERAAALLTKNHMSAFAGHQQGRDIAYGKRGDGVPMTAIIAGSFYDHKEKYLSPQSNNHWRGIYMLNEVRDGHFDEMAISLGFLKRKYL